MKTNVVQLHNITPEDLKKEILEGVAKKLEELKSQLQNKEEPSKYLTRKEVSEILGVSLVTIHHWCKKGILKPYYIGNRVRFKNSEIEKAFSG